MNSKSSKLHGIEKGKGSYTQKVLLTEGYMATVETKGTRHLKYNRQLKPFSTSTEIFLLLLLLYDSTLLERILNIFHC